MNDDTQQTVETTPHLDYGLKPILSVDEAAQFLRCNIKTVYAAIAAKQLPGRRVGKRLVIFRDALLDYLRSTEDVLPARRRKR